MMMETKAKQAAATSGDSLRLKRVRYNLSHGNLMHELDTSASTFT